jgi:hypothetical protein
MTVSIYLKGPSFRAHPVISTTHDPLVLKSVTSPMPSSMEPTASCCLARLPRATIPSNLVSPQSVNFFSPLFTMYQPGSSHDGRDLLPCRICYLLPSPLRRASSGNLPAHTDRGDCCNGRGRGCAGAKCWCDSRPVYEWEHCPSYFQVPPQRSHHHRYVYFDMFPPLVN